MSIDKWYLMGLKSEPLKRHAHRVAAAVHCLPEDRLVHFPAAIENEDMPDKIGDIARMMVDDGFPEWEWHVTAWDRPSPRPRAWLAADWTKLRCLRHAAEQTGETAMHITQTLFINIIFRDIEKIVASLPNLKMAAFYSYKGEHGYQDGHLKWLLEALEDTNIAVEGLRETKINHIYKNFGLQADASARIFTAEGAREHLQMWREQPWVDSQFCTYYFTRKYGFLDGYYYVESSPSAIKALYSKRSDYLDVRSKDKMRDTLSQKHLNQILGELRGSLTQISDDQVAELINAIINAQRVFVAGAGRSGLAMRAFAMRLMHLEFETYVVGETITPSITSSDLLLIGSGSGATSSCVANAREAQAIGATICLITIDKESPIGQIADVALTIPAPSPKIDKELGFNSLQPMSSLFEQSLLLTLDAIILLLMDKKGKDTATMLPQHANLE